jgi:pSer/pThr/pTyr-binding forkhead associated (FHA) protein
MIVCPNCHHEEIAGALFCSECGAQLVVSDHRSTQSITRSPTDVLGTNGNPPIEIPPLTTGEDTIISLHLVGSGQVLHLAGRTEFTLGRVAEGQPILPDVDLSVYEAYSQGVSRLHAALKFVNQRVVITDLGSANGTRVNGQKIMPHIDYPLNHGDMIALGKLKIQVLIRK